MKVLICPSQSKITAKDFVMPIAEFFMKNGANAYIDDRFKLDFPLKTLGNEETVDIILTLGGDGTILYHKHKYIHMIAAKIASVNLGTLGFMASIKVDEFKNYLQDLVNGDYHVENRLMIQVKGPNGNLIPVINDVVAYRSKVSSMILLKLHINNQ